MVDITGPVVGGEHGWSFGTPTVDLDAAGYELHEYFISGEAVRYELVGGSDYSRDGRWTAHPVDPAPYKTRIVVCRPGDPARFNGTVLVLWNNVSAGYENFGGGDSPEIFENGFAWAAVSAQSVGVHGVGDNPQGLETWDPQRYGELSVISDDYSFDIFTQAANMVAPDRPRHHLDPMDGLDVERLVAQGASQSAARLATYLNAVQPLTDRFDAFFLLMYFGGGTPLTVGNSVMTVQATSDSNAPKIPEGLNLLRDDLQVPVMVINTECEASSCYPVRQPDGDNFRYWEIAGASHVSLQALTSSAPRLQRDFGFSIPLDDSMASINQISIAPVVDAGLHHLQNWMTGNGAPPIQPRIEFTGDPARIERDADGIALGGLRLPAVDVPAAHNSAMQRAPGIFARLVGFHDAFSDEELRRRYGSRERYLEELERATGSAESAGVILPRDVSAVIEEAAATFPL